MAAQQTQPITPPVITPVPPPAETPAPAPQPSPGITFAPQSPVVQAVPPPPAPPPEATATEAPAPRATATRQRTTRVEQRTTRTTPAPLARAPSAPAAAAPAAAPAPAPVPVAQAPAAPAAVTPAPVPAPVPVATPVPAPAQSEISSGAAWALLAIPVIAILALAMLFFRRRRASAVAYEDTYYAPMEEAPIAIEPAADAAPVVPVADEDATARPWIDIGLRPIRAEGGLDVEVTVSNSGDAPAHDVRVSTWMLNGTESSDGEQALIDARSGAQIATVDVAPGGDKSVDTTMALPTEAGTPILVAEARYPLPLGGEGRIAATFEIDVTHGDIEARLHDVLERA